MREDYGKLDKVKMSIWECCKQLNEVVNESDPGLDEPQIEHFLRTVEAIRKDYHDWPHPWYMLLFINVTLSPHSFLVCLCCYYKLGHCQPNMGIASLAQTSKFNEYAQINPTSQFLYIVVTS